MSSNYLDPAITSALSLDPSKTSVSSHGSSGFSTTAKITTTLPDGTQQRFFMKTSKGAAAAVMFKGEAASLNAIHAAVPSFCPKAFAFGQLQQDPGSHFLVTDFLDLNGRGSRGQDKGGSRMSLAQKLGKLHTTPAPPPEGHQTPMFGFPVTTCCGDTPQANGYMASWAQFYAENRLLAILKRAENRNGKDFKLRESIEILCAKVVPRLIGDNLLNNGNGVIPVVVHGDLWSGNVSTGVIGGGEGPEEDVVFDPSACYAHSEYELGIMQMFGGFSGSMKEYHEICPKTAPVAEFKDRVSLYEV